MCIHYGEAEADPRTPSQDTALDQGYFNYFPGGSSLSDFSEGVGLELQDFWPEGGLELQDFSGAKRLKTAPKAPF